MGRQQSSFVHLWTATSAKLGGKIDYFHPFAHIANKIFQVFKELLNSDFHAPILIIVRDNILDFVDSKLEKIE